MLKVLIDKAKSDVTKKSYSLKISKALEVTGCSSVERMLKSADTSLKKLEKHYPKNSTLKQTLTVIVSLISANPDWRDKNPRPSSKWVTAHGSASRIMAEQRKFTKYEEVKNKFVCLEDIVKMKKRLKKAANTGDLQDSLTYLLLVMCVDIPPKRADYNDLKMVTKEPFKGNYVIMHAENKMELVMHEYKTQREVAYREMLPKQVSRDISASLDAFPRLYLFSGSDGGCMTPSAYSQWVIRRFTALFGKGVGLSSIRHIYITDMYQRNATKAEKESVAKSMQHSVTMQKTYVVMKKSGKAIC
jgi:hypothetical protein